MASIISGLVGGTLAGSSLNTNVISDTLAYDRKLTTIIKGDFAVTFEVFPKTGVFTNKFITHVHSVTEYFPSHKELKKNALLYFTINDASYFEQIELLNKLDVHNHDGVYYVDKNNRQIYCFKDDVPYSKLLTSLTHTHSINVTFTPVVK